ncbi:efflux RND transporter permease subunit [Novosphingobium sp.]|uniref:efflux RND transporter permease subunit n=1 Tax=Novosphingobium sp. TaxID=1874826 RepID=UPI0031D92486
MTKSPSSFLLIVGLYDESDKATMADISDYLVSNLQDPLSRIEGVGDVQVFGSQYAMRIWLDPNKLASYALMPSDITNADQRAERPGGRRPARRAAQPGGPAAERHGKRPVAAADAGTVRPDHA